MNDGNGVLIFGGGLIGTAAAAHLSARALPVTVITRAPAPQRLRNVNWQFGWVQNSNSERFLAGYRAVVYAAGSMIPASRLTSTAKVLIDQVVPVVQLAEQAAQSGVSTFVFISSGGTVYGPTKIIPTNEDVCTAPINAYGMVKVQTEQALLEVARQSSMNVINLRVSNPYGPAQQGTRSIGFIAAAIEAAQQGTPLQIWGDGLNQRDFIYLDDVAEAIGAAVDVVDPSLTLNIGSGQATSLAGICEQVEMLSGRTLTIEYQTSRSVDVRCSTLDITKAANYLKWHPKVSLETGILNTLKAHHLI